MGFDQQKSTRTYRFDQVEKGARIARLMISADLDLFLKNQVALQEGPVLCARKLASDLEQSRPMAHILTDEDLLAFATTRATVAAQKAEMRGRQPKRRLAPPKSSSFGRFMLGSPYRG
jgi:hypothetical protein